MVDRLALKLCGLRSRADITAGIAAGATMIGFNMIPASPRAVDPDEVGALIRYLRGETGAPIEAIGLTDTADPDAAAGLLARSGVDRLQFHGRYDEAAERALIGAFPGALIARGVRGPEDLPRSGAPRPHLWVLDAKPPKDTALRGGTGRSFDWTLLAEYDHPSPFLLAGGLTPDTVGGAIRAAARHPHFAGVDVSSGIERDRGRKDPELISAFATAAHAAMGAPSSPGTTR